MDVIYLFRNTTTIYTRDIVYIEESVGITRQRIIKTTFMRFVKIST